MGLCGGRRRPCRAVGALRAAPFRRLPPPPVLLKPQRGGGLGPCSALPRSAPAGAGCMRAGARPGRRVSAGACAGRRRPAVDRSARPLRAPYGPLAGSLMAHCRTSGGEGRAGRLGGRRAAPRTAPPILPEAWWRPSTCARPAIDCASAGPHRGGWGGGFVGIEGRAKAWWRPPPPYLPPPRPSGRPAGQQGLGPRRG